MSDYVNQKDPVIRTIDNLRGSVRWDATHLINSLLGVMVYPVELLRRDPNSGFARYRRSRSDMEADGWPVNSSRVTVWHNDNQGFPAFIRHVRNAISHANFKSIPDLKGNIAKFRMIDKYTRDSQSHKAGDINFDATFELGDIENIIQLMGRLVGQLMP